MTTPLPPELTVKIVSLVNKWLPDACLRGVSLIEEAYPLIAAHVAKRAAEICNRVAGEDLTHYIGDSAYKLACSDCVNAIERELTDRRQG